MIKAVIFDYDDTLVQSLKINTIALQRVAEKYYDKEIPKTTIENAWGLAYKEMLRKIFGDSDDVERISKRYQEYLATLPLQAEPKAVEAITALNSRFLLGILTASERKEVIRELGELGFGLTHFYVIQTAEDTIAHKPDPAVFDPLIKKFAAKGIRSDQMVYVGDSLRDLEAAQQSGIIFYAFPHGLTPIEEFKKRNVPILSKLTDLLSLDYDEK